MSGDYDDVVGGEIETSITFVISGVSEEDTTSGPGSQFVGSLCGKVGIANTAEHAQVLIWGCDTIKSDIRAGDVDYLAREVIQQVRSGVKPFYPVTSRHRGLKQQGVDHIIDGVKRTLNFTVLWRGVWAGNPQDDHTRGKGCMGGGIVELTIIVTLDDFDGQMWEKCQIKHAKEKSTQYKSDHQG
jgi:hypothetical protein